MKKVLFVYPHNFLELNMGTNIRVCALARELRALGYEIDLFALEHFMSTYEHFDEMNAAEGLVSHLYLCDYKPIRAWQKRRRRLRRWMLPFARKRLDDWAAPCMVRLFDRLMATGGYTHVVMFYTYAARLLDTRRCPALRTVSKIYFMEDLLSVGEYIQGRSRTVGELLDCELARMERFDRIACISFDEKIIIEKLLRGGQRFYFLPHVIERKEAPRERIPSQPLRVTFVGYDNPYNVEGVRWFLEHVYPLLDKRMNIRLVGRVNRHITCHFPNVTQEEYAPDLESVYRETDVVICPLLNGTGMKIKVVEAMSHSIPVVCTSRGIDGFPDKTTNGCLVADTPELFAAHLNRIVGADDFYRMCTQRVANYFEHALSWVRHSKTLADLFEKD